MESEGKKRKATTPERHRTEAEGDHPPSKNFRDEDKKVHSRPNYDRHSGGHGRNYFGSSQNTDRSYSNYHHRNRHDESSRGRNYTRKRSHSRDRDNRDRRDSSYHRRSTDRQKGNGDGESSSASQRERTHGQSYFSKGYSKRDTKAAPRPDTTTEQKDSSEDLEEDDLRPLSLNVSCPAASTLVKQIEKRKLLFSKKETPQATTSTTASVWQQTKFTDDSDGKMSAKFKRLMGMKDGGKAEGGAAQGGTTNAGKDVRVPAEAQSKDFFINLEKQYEVARTITHTQRGVGLGFGSATALSRSSTNQGKHN